MVTEALSRGGGGHNYLKVGQIAPLALAYKRIPIANIKFQACMISSSNLPRSDCRSSLSLSVVAYRSVLCARVCLIFGNGNVWQHSVSAVLSISYGGHYWSPS